MHYRVVIVVILNVQGGIFRRKNPVPSGLTGKDILALLHNSAPGGRWDVNTDTRAERGSLRVDLDKPAGITLFL